MKKLIFLLFAILAVQITNCSANHRGIDKAISKREYCNEEPLDGHPVVLIVIRNRCSEIIYTYQDYESYVTNKKDLIKMFKKKEQKQFNKYTSGFV